MNRIFKISSGLLNFAQYLLFTNLYLVFPHLYPPSNHTVSVNSHHQLKLSRNITPTFMESPQNSAMLSAPLFQSKKQRKTRVVKKWSPEEDQTMLALVAVHGIKSWGLVASKLGGRSGKQCRERYHNQLDPSIKKCPWTEEEEQLLMRLHRQFGNRWAEISKHIEGRTDNSIKNHYNSAKRRLTNLPDGSLAINPSVSANAKSKNEPINLLSTHIAETMTAGGFVPPPIYIEDMAASDGMTPTKGPYKRRAAEENSPISLSADHMDFTTPTSLTLPYTMSSASASASASVRPLKKRRTKANSPSSVAELLIAVKNSPVNSVDNSANNSASNSRSQSPFGFEHEALHRVRLQTVSEVPVSPMAGAGGRVLFEMLSSLSKKQKISDALVKEEKEAEETKATCITPPQQHSPVAAN